MKKNVEEMILLYNFNDVDRVQALTELLKSMKIKVKVLKHDDYKQKVGFLFGLKGFSEHKDSDENGETFDFAYELMMFNNFNRARLDAVLKNMRAKDIEVPICKSVVTLLNRFWTIRRVCEAMQKEHLAMRKQQDNK